MSGDQLLRAVVQFFSQAGSWLRLVLQPVPIKILLTSGGGYRNGVAFNQIVSGLVKQLVKGP